MSMLFKMNNSGMAGNAAGPFVSVSLPANTVITNSQASTSGQLFQGNSQTITLSSLPQTIVTSSGSTLLIQPSHDQASPGNNLPLTPVGPVTVDLPSIGGNQSTSDEPGVLLCNLDDLSKYIPENFYSDFTMADQSGVADYLQTVVAGKTSTTTVSAATSLSNGNVVTQQPSTIQLPITMAQPTLTSPNQQPITIQLPTQPQPVQGVKTVTYVNPVISKASPQQVTTVTSSAATLQPLRVTQYAYTQSGERIAIQGLDPSQYKPGSTIQLQVKGGGTQTLQLQNIQGLNVDPSKLTVLQELPEVGKVVIQEARSMGDPITSILEEMKGGSGGAGDETVTLNTGSMEYATAIPVNVTHLASDPKKTTIKRVAAPTSTVFLPGNKTSRNIIFAGNTLPQGAIPIQINGINAIPLSAVKSLPISISNITTAAGVPTVAKRTKVEIIPANAKTVTTALPVVTKVTNNNSGGASAVSALTKTISSSQQAQQRQNQQAQASSAQNQSALNRTVGNNKTCNWVFENGEVCGKTFAKSYNLVVHMRMHEDVRPFGCSFCDQTFRQKAHLQRHETTHGVGVKVNRGSASAQRRKRKRSRGGTSSGGGGQATAGTVVMTTSTTLSANLQQRLARVSEQFGTNVVGGTVLAKGGDHGEDDDDDEDDEDLSVNHSGGTIKSYSKRKLSSDEKDMDDEDEDDEDGLSESKTTVTIQLDHHQQANPQVFQSSYVDVQDEVSDLRDEDIIEAVPGTTVVMTSAPATTTSSVDVAVAAAVSEAIKDIEYEAASAAANASASVEDAVNVRVEAQPVDTHANMSPETLTAISGSSSPQPPPPNSGADHSENPDQSSKNDSEMQMQDLFQDEK